MADVELGRGIVSLLQFDEFTIPAIEPFMGEVCWSGLSAWEKWVWRALTNNVSN